MSDNIEIKIVDELISNIKNKKYDSNDKLPSENDLSDAYGVPRIVVRKAYDRLDEMGYVYSKQGKGRFLTERHKYIDLDLSGYESFSEKMIIKGYDLRSKNILFTEIKYNEKIFMELEADISDKVYKIGRLRILGDIPIAMHISYVSSTTFPSIEKSGNVISSMFEYYKNHGYSKFASQKSILSISFPTKKNEIYSNVQV